MTSCSALKRLLPLRLRVALRDTVDYWVIRLARDIIHRRVLSDGVGDLYRNDRYLCPGYLSYQAYRILLQQHASRVHKSIDYLRVHNALPNSGPIPITQNFSSVREVVATFQERTKRSQGIAGFEGFAPDDAVFDETAESGELWSNARLAGVIASFGYANYRNPSVLELGCGPAHLFFFLSRYGIQNYLGIDGNPLVLKYIPHVRGYEDRFLLLNLQQEIRLYEGNNPLRFDVICSFEVLEHMREEVVDNLIQTMRNHMHSRSVAYCTASLQDGMDVHVLVRSRDWWLERFARCGLHPRGDEAKLCQELCMNHPFNWDPANTSIFALEARW